jgi:acetolactate synthase-1/2/3 large subunit
MSVGEPDFILLSRAYGIEGVVISEREELIPQLQKALSNVGPVIVNVNVRKGENCYPMVPPGKSNAQMVGIPKIKL